MGGPSIKKTRLHDWHLGAGARMAEFAGWDMPIQYPAGPREEHMRVRNAAGLFDIDHMGRFTASGSGAIDFLQSVQTWDVSLIRPGRAHYSLLCSQSGGIIDDIFIYRLPSRASEAAPDVAAGYRSAGAVTAAFEAPTEEWLIVVNAANREKDFAWLSANAARFDVSLRDASAETCMVSLQGPAAAEILKGLTDPLSAAIGYHRVTRCSVAGAPCILCATGYTGEPGYELLIEAGAAPARPCARRPLGRREAPPAVHGLGAALEVWQALLSTGAPRGLLPCGLAARDSLRSEAGLPLYGQEIGEDTDPFRAGLGKAAVSLAGHDFIGKAVLLELSLRPADKTLVGFQMTEASVPRHGYAITAGGRVIGGVTTGLFGPATGRYIGMGYVEPGFSEEGQAVEVIVRGAPKAARIVGKPFYRSPHWKKEK